MNNRNNHPEWMELLPKESREEKPGPSSAAHQALEPASGWASWQNKISEIISQIRLFLHSRTQRSALGDAPTQKNERQAQRRNTALAVVIIACILCAAVWLFNQYSSHRKTIRTPPRPVSDFTIAPANIDKETFRADFDHRMGAVEGQLSSLESFMRSMEARVKALKDASGKEGKEKPFSVASGPVPSPAYHADPFELPVMGTLPATVPAIGRIEFSSPPNARSDSGNAQSVLSRQTKPQATPSTPYIPSGSFARAVLLAGVSAPTGANALQDPVPMLLEIAAPAQLPNEYKSHVKRCFVTANAVADLSSERVWVRLERLSCVKNEKTVLDLPVRGYAVGEDGKTGIRAQLVERSGQAIANAIFLGTLSGLGKAVSLSAQDSLIYNSGSSSQSVRDPWKAGLGEGASNALDRIADYYLKMLDRVFPVLEIGGGREVDIVFSQGFSLTPRTENSSAPSSVTINSAERFGATIQRQRRSID